VPNVKTSFSSAAFLAVLVSLGFAVVPAYGQAGAAGSSASGTSVAVIDIPLVFKNLTRFTQAMNDIKRDVDSYKEFFEGEQKKLRAEAEKIEQFKPGTPEYKQVEENVARMKVEMQLEASKRQKEFMDREAMVYYNAYREVEAAVTEFAQRYGIALVIRYSSEPMDPAKKETVMQGINRMVVYQSRLDITNNILEILNRGTPPVRQATQPTSPSRTGAPQIPPRPTTR
jgi:Skp family chaperone for outer membrane proteins